MQHAITITTTSVSLPTYNALTIIYIYSNISNSLNKNLEVQPVCKNDGPETLSADEGWILSIYLWQIFTLQKKTCTIECSTTKLLLRHHNWSQDSGQQRTISLEKKRSHLSFTAAGAKNSLWQLKQKVSMKYFVPCLLSKFTSSEKQVQPY